MSSPTARRRALRRTLAAAATLALVVGATADAVEVEVSPDVPATLGVTKVASYQTATSQGGGGGYTLKFAGGTLGGSANVDALCRISETRILLSTDAPFESGGTRYGAADVIEHDGTGFAMYQSAASMGISTESANVDGIALTAAGELLVTFETPTTAGTTVYQPADVAIFDGSSLSTFFDASAAATPLGDQVNVNGLEYDDGGVGYFTFDVHIIAGGEDIRNGEVISYDTTTGAVAKIWQDSASFETAGRAIADFSFKTPPGSVPPTVTVTKDDAAGSSLTISWSASPCPATGYAVYEGDLATLASGYDHDTRIATVTGTSAPGLVPQTEIAYYLVVPRNGDFEGSYGKDSDGDERPGAARGATGADLPKMSRGCQ